MASRTWLFIAVASFAAAFVVPLAVSGELGAWRLTGPVPYLVWDEAMEGPGEDGVTAPGPGDELASPLRTLVALLVLPAVLAGAVSWWARRMVIVS